MPSVVNGVKVENLLSGRRFLIEWGLNLPNEGVSVYQIWRSTTEQSGFVKIADIYSPTNQFIDKVPFTYGVTFFYKVVAVTSGGISSDITAVTGTSDVTFDNFDEEPFRATNLTFDSFVKNETPVGVVDGLNAVFQTVYLYRVNMLEVFVNGVLRLSSDYSMGTDQKTFTFIFPPALGSVVRVNYLKI